MFRILRYRNSDSVETQTGFGLLNACGVHAVEAVEPHSRAESVKIASRLRCTSEFVVAHEQTPIRIA